MVYEWGRFMWWLYHDPNAPGVVQAIASAVTVLVTVILCALTYGYMVLTKKLADTASERFRASVRPIIEVTLDFGGALGPSGVPVFTNEAGVTISNIGPAPMVINPAFLRWQHSKTIGQERRQVAGFDKNVLAAGKKIRETQVMQIEQSDPEVDDFETWSRDVTFEVFCWDIGGASGVQYNYQRRTGLRVAKIWLAHFTRLIVMQCRQCNAV